jgi:hypothetical protein
MDKLTNIDLLDTTTLSNNTNIKLVYYHTTRDKFYPFIQIMLYNYNSLIPFLGFQEQKFIFPSIFYNSQININKVILDNLKENLAIVDCVIEDKSKIYINGYYIYNEEIYIFVDISIVKLERIYLTKNTEIWFALSHEIVNTKNICNIQIGNEVSDFFTNNIQFLTEIDNNMYPSPEVIYVGDHLKRVEFQNLFGVSKSEKIYGEYYYFTYYIEDALRNGAWSKDKLPEYRFGKLLTDDENGRYIEGGINRIAILLENSIYINESQVNDMINNEEWEDFLLQYDCVYIVLENKSILILLNDYMRQYPLSYHKINKKTLTNDIIEIV